jgi:hypothetical protein
MTGPVPIFPNTDKLRILKRIDQRRQAPDPRNRDKTLFGAVEDQCNDSVGLPQSWRFEVLKGKRTPPPTMVLGWGTGSEVLHVEHAELARRRSLSIKTGCQIPTSVATYIPGQRSPWPPANADWNQDPDIEEELDFSNAGTLEESLRLMDYPGPALFRVKENKAPDTSNYILKWHEDVSPTDIYLTVIDNSTRDVEHASRPSVPTTTDVSMIFL